MRFLIDQNLSERLAELLRNAGHDAAHVRTLGLSRAPDAVILDRASAESRVLISGDTDFGALLATGHRREPSVILIRRERPRRPEAQATLLLGYLDRVATAQGRVGADLRTIDEQKARLSEMRRASVKRLSALEDTNMAAAITGMAQADAAYKAALGAVSSVTRMSLMDYLR